MEESTTTDLAPVTLSKHYWEEDEDIAFVSQGFSDDNNRYIGTEQGLEKALELALLLVYKRSGQFSMFAQIGMKGSKCGITIYNAEPKDAQLINDTIMNCTAWSMEKSGALTEEVEKYVQFGTSNDDLDSIDDGTVAIMKELETKKTIRHLGVFAKCNAPDTTETGRRALQNVRMRIEDVKLRNKSGNIAVLTTHILLVTVTQWNTLRAISSLEDCIHALRIVKVIMLH